MAGSIILNNIKKLRDTLQDQINYTDLDFELKGRRGISVYYGDAMVVAYILWLRSMPGDYIRNPTKGGFFRNQLNRYPFSPDSASKIEDDLKAETNQLFPDIEIIDIKAECVYGDRKWKIKVSIVDKNTGILGSTSVVMAGRDN